jgi:6-phosphogluconolactonase (cycloisomerase 2 family)
MKIGRLASVVMTAILLLAGCKNFFNVPTTTGCTANCTTTTISSGVFYVLNSNAGQVEIAGYSIVNSKLTALTGSPNILPSGPYAIAIAPNDSFLYVSTQSGIYLYTIGLGGALTLASTTPISTDFAATSMQVDMTGSWLVVASGSGYLYAVPISPSTGKPTGTVQQVSLGGILPRQLKISPDNNNVFVALGGSGTEVIPFSATSTNPLPETAPVPIAVKGQGGAALSVAVDPAGQLLFIGETLGTFTSGNTGVLRAFLYSSLSGTPTEVTGSPNGSGGLTPVSILPTAYGGYVYVANSTVSNSSTGNIAGFAISASSNAYSLTSLSGTTAAGTTPADLAEDSTGSVVLLVNSGGSPDLDVYTFDTTTLGKLDSALTFSTGTDPVGALAIAAAP